MPDFAILGNGVCHVIIICYARKKLALIGMKHQLQETAYGYLSNNAKLCKEIYPQVFDIESGYLRYI